MTSNKPEQNTPNALGFDYSDIANYERFMEALETFMNESSICIQQVKMRSGISPGCASPVKMNSEEKQTKMNEILHSLAEKYKEEAKKANEEAQRNAARINPNATYTAPQQMRPYPAAAPPSTCPCAPSRKSRRGDSGRPATSPARGRMGASDSYYMPSSQSAMSSQYGECPAASRGRRY